MVQIVALPDGGGPSHNTLIPSGTNAMHRPSIRKGDSNLVPLRVPKGKKNMEANAADRKNPNKRER